MTLGQSQEMTLTLNTHILLSTHLVVCIYLCSGHRLEYFPKNPLFSLFPKEKSKFQNRSRSVQGQHLNKL